MITFKQPESYITRT